MFQFGFFLWGVWMIFVWITAHEKSHPLIIALVSSAALFCLLLASYGLKQGLLGNHLLKKGTFAEGEIVSRKRTSIFVSGAKGVSGGRRSQMYLWRMTVQFEVPGQAASSSFKTLASAEYGTGPAEEFNVGRTLVMYNPNAPSQAMRIEDIPLENQFESFDKLAPSEPPMKILIWPTIIVVGNVWGLVSLVQSW